MNAKDVLDANEEYGTESALFTEMFKQKERWISEYRMVFFLEIFYVFRQQNMQRQLEKATDLVRLIVQKMEIPAEIEVDDTSKIDKNQIKMRIQKFRQTFNTVRRFNQLQSSISDSWSRKFHLFIHLDQFKWLYNEKGVSIFSWLIDTPLIANKKKKQQQQMIF